MALPRGNAALRQSLRLLEAVERSYIPRASLLTTPLTGFRAPQRSSRSSVRHFSSSPCLQRKRKIVDPSYTPNAAGESGRDSVSSKDGGSQQLDPENPLDMSALTAAYGPIDAHFKPKLQTLVAGGRFNPTSIGALPVPLKPDPTSSTASSGGDTPETFPLRELAQVVPRGGRTISLLVNEKAYIKPIMSAVQASREFNQQPQRAEGNDLELLLRVEPERPGEAAKRVRELGQAWRERVRGARTRHEKTLKEWRKTGAVLPDAVRKAEKELQKTQDGKMHEIDREEAMAVKQLERNSS